MARLCKLLIAMGTSVNVGHFLNVLDQEGVVTVPTNGHQLDAYGVVVSRLPCKPPSTVLTGLLYTNTKFKRFLNFL